MYKIGIIGTAGRGENIKYLNGEIWDRMVMITRSYIEKNITTDWRKVTLVSGGAAWSDHIAVRLFMEIPGAKLTLHLPCKFDRNEKRFVDNGNKESYLNPGLSANRYHHYFKNKIGSDSFEELDDAIECGTKVYDRYKGFLHRNLAVGKVDYLLAFTFDDHKPESGGTKHTWDKSKCQNKIHFNINQIISLSV